LPTDRQTLQAIAYTYSFVGGKLVSDKQLGHSTGYTVYMCFVPVTCSMSSYWWWGKRWKIKHSEHS